MAACRGNSGVSIAMDGGYRLCSLFSVATFRRKLIESVICGEYRDEREIGMQKMEQKEKPCSSPKLPRSCTRSERLAELLKVEVQESSSELEAAARRKTERLEELQGVVKRLQDSCRLEAAKDVRRLAKEDVQAREMLAMLGAIPPLVAMIDSSDLEIQIASLYALLNLCVGNDKNKAAIAEAGAIHNMLMLIQKTNPPIRVVEVIAANFLSLSALDANKPLIGSSAAIRFLVEAFRSTSSALARHDALRALVNLSIAADNIPRIVESGVISDILCSVGDMDTSERLLSVLSNVVSSVDGRKAISQSTDSIPILIDVLRWSDSPECQEKASYILMVMAHKSYNDRAAMNEAGIASSLLELTLMGSSLAQRRASRILDCLRTTKGKQISGVGPSFSAMSAPQSGAWQEEEPEWGASEERKAVKSLVEQSMQNNLRRIARRANLETLVNSKSLPF